MGFVQPLSRRRFPVIGGQGRDSWREEVVPGRAISLLQSLDFKNFRHFKMWGTELASARLQRRKSEARWAWFSAAQLIMNYLVINNPHRHRFETTVDAHVAVLNYKQKGKCITFIHTEVPQELAGRGVGSALAKAGLGYAREQGLQVIPKCEFVASYIEKHPGFADLLGSGS